MKAIGFDLGRTLIFYENVPLNWKSLYKEALSSTLLKCGCEETIDSIAVGEEILSKYNTRINYREIEISSDVIFSEIIGKWKLSKEILLPVFKKNFFSFFQRNVLLFPDTIALLQTLKEMGIKTGILTDVPYGMDREFVLSDVEPFKELIDVLLTSVDVGHRKPNVQGYIKLADKLGVKPEDMIYVGDEPKDILGATNAGMYSVLIERGSSNLDLGQKKKIKELSELIKFV
jgi:putative hydrolase of the HAD superfamily